MSWRLCNGVFLAFKYTFRDFVFILPHGIKTLINFMFCLATCIHHHVTFSISSFRLERGLRDCSVPEITHVQVSSVACHCNLFINVARCSSFFQFMVLQGFICTTEKQRQWAKVSSVRWIHDHNQLDKPHNLGPLWTSDQPDAETAM